MTSCKKSQKILCCLLETPGTIIPDLPHERALNHPPFTNTGIDFTGPLYISEKNNAEKVYICLFTCASMGAIHLELTPDMGVDAFLLAMRRFTSW